jgi:photosystem II stability/assembly factor-like uncharacterized protein
MIRLAIGQDHPVRVGYRLLLFSLIFCTVSGLFISPTNAQSFDSVMHIHSANAFGGKVLLGTHNGLFEFVGQNNMKPVGTEPFDTMGLASYGSTLFASGHPAPGSKLPEPLGLLRSDDSGKSWKLISLQGKVDFHFLQAGKSELYGVDAQSGDLMYSANLGKSWRSVGKNRFSDIAISNQKIERAYAVEKGKLLLSNDALKTQTIIKTGFEVSAIESVGKILYAASGKDIYRSQDEGRSWKKLSSFKAAVSDITASEQIIAAIVGSEVLISRDKGKSFKR